jgi:hypothetical protein
MLMSGRTYDCLLHDGSVGIKWGNHGQVAKVKKRALTVEQAASARKE